MEYDDSLSVGDKESGNLIIQGDNLHALKALLPYYAGKIKCIYIDPPYNTGKEGWKYNDNVNAPEIKKWLNEVVGKEGEDLSRHDKWLCMMYPRLKLLHKLLNRKGILFVSIDDNEIDRLKFLMDELFNEKNRLAILVWDLGTGTTAGHFTRQHEYILCYAKDKSLITNFLNPNTEEAIKHGALKKPSVKNPLSPITFPIGMEIETKEEKIFSGRIGGSEFMEIEGEMHFKNGSLIKPVTIRAGWAMRNQILSWLNGEPTYDSKGQKIIKFFFNSSGILWYEKDKSIVNPPSVLRSIANTKQGSAILNEILPDSDFPFPKPINLINYLISLVTKGNDIILDSFAGTGTTAYTVISLNNIDKNNRKYILIELEENIAKNITSERVKRVINGYEVEKTNGTKEKVEGLGSGFRYCKLGEPLFDKFGNVHKGVKFRELAFHIFFSETGVPLKENTKFISPFIGKFKGTAYYLLFNGILGDKSVNGGNVLTSKILSELKSYNGQKIIFGESCRLSLARLKKENIIFKQIPYEIKTS